MTLSTTSARSEEGTFFMSERDMMVVDKSLKHPLPIQRYSDSMEITPLSTGSRVVFLGPERDCLSVVKFLRSRLESRQKKSSEGLQTGRACD